MAGDGQGMYEGSYLASLRRDNSLDMRGFVVNQDNFDLAQKFLASPDYVQVEYDADSGGLMAKQKGHSSKKQNGRDTGKVAEIECEKQLYKDGHSVILLANLKNAKGNSITSLDMELDGRVMDIASILNKDSNISNILSRKTKQIADYLINRRNRKICDSVCLYYADSTFFDEQKLIDGISNLYSKIGKEKYPKEWLINNIVCVIKGQKETKEYTIETIKPIHRSE